MQSFSNSWAPATPELISSRILLSVSGVFSSSRLYFRRVLGVTLSFSDVFLFLYKASYDQS